MAGAYNEDGLNPAQVVFLANYIECGNVSTAAFVAGVSRSVPYGWREHNPDFAAAFADAQQTRADRLEQEVYRRAVEGVVKHKFDRHGQPLLRPGATLDDSHPYYEEREYSDTLLLRLCEKTETGSWIRRTQLTGAEGGPLQLDATVDVKHDDNWYGNEAHDLAAKSAATSTASAALAVPVQGGGVRPTLGEDGDGPVDDDEGARSAAGTAAGST